MKKVESMNEQNIIDEIQSCFELKVNMKGLLFLEKRIIALKEENKQLKENNQSMQAEMTMTWNKLDKKEEKIHNVIEYIYKNSIPISLTVNPPIHKLIFEGDINEVLKILEDETK